MTKVLIIRFSSIGDIVLTTPVVRNLKEQMHGGVEIHYLTKKAFEHLVAPNPHISKVYTIEKSTNEVVEQLKQEGYDYLIDLHRNLRSMRVRKALGVLDFAFEKYNFQKWLLVNFGINRMPDLHIVDRYMATIERFGIVNDNKGLDYFIPADEDSIPESIPKTHRSGYVAMAIGAAHWRKRPRDHQFVAMCKALGCPVLLLGGPDDRDRGQEIAKAAGSHVWNAAGALSLHGSAVMVRGASAVVTPDTGLMHIAAAFKKPIVSLWAATVPAFGMTPYQNGALNAMIEPSHLTRRPCSKLGTRCKYKACRCVDELPIETAVTQVQAAMEASREAVT